jgi:hypothetical protein
VRALPQILGLAALLALSAAAQAWSYFGHQQIAELAERELAPSTRAAALALLEGEADSLAAVAAWADEVRDDPAYEWSHALHFVNFPRGRCQYRADRDCVGGHCVVAAIERFRAELGDASLPRQRRAEALRFLVHFVGDVHQPLHAGFGHDKGGNTYQVNIDGEGSNLHRLWDFWIPQRGGEDRAAQLAALSASPLPPPGALQPAAWAEASCRLVDSQGFYPQRRRLSAADLDRFLPLAQAQMRLAAARLAALLEAELGTH